MTIFSDDQELENKKEEVDNMLDNQEEICSRIEESVWQIPDHILH
jgi:hypothetical protein